MSNLVNPITRLIVFGLIFHSEIFMINCCLWIRNPDEWKRTVGQSDANKQKEKTENDCRDYNCSSFNSILFVHSPDRFFFFFTICTSRLCGNLCSPLTHAINSFRLLFARKTTIKIIPLKMKNESCVRDVKFRLRLIVSLLIVRQ